MTHAGGIEEVAARVPAEVEEPARRPLLRGRPIGIALLAKIRPRRDQLPGLPGVSALPEARLFVSLTHHNDLSLVPAEEGSPGRFQGAALRLPGRSLIFADQQALPCYPVADALEHTQNAPRRGVVRDFRPGHTTIPAAQDAIALAGDQRSRVKDADRRVVLAQQFPGFAAIRAEVEFAVRFVMDREEHLGRSLAPIHRAVIPAAPVLLEGVPGLAVVEGDGAGAVQHKAGQALACGIRVQRIARLAPPAGTAAVHADKRRASVRTPPDALIRHDHPHIAGGAIHADARRLPRPAHFLTFLLQMFEDV